MDTPTEQSFARVRAYFASHPKKLSAAARSVGLAYTTAKSALEGQNPTVKTLIALERTIPHDFCPMSAPDEAAQ